MLFLATKQFVERLLNVFSSTVVVEPYCVASITKTGDIRIQVGC